VRLLKKSFNKTNSHLLRLILDFLLQIKNVRKQLKCVETPTEKGPTLSQLFGTAIKATYAALNKEVFLKGGMVKYKQLPNIVLLIVFLWVLVQCLFFEEG